MRNKVVHTAARAARDLGMPVLRFNFRGVGGSAGSFDRGRGEAEDLRAAMDYLAAAYPGFPIVAGGVSFGAWVAAAVGGTDDRVAALISIATPIGLYGTATLKGITKPALFVHASEDEFGPVDEVARAVQAYEGPGRLVRVEGTTHLFPGRTDEVYEAVQEFLQEIVEGEMRHKETGSRG
jgi:alpha/beta superfamily hydrolase